MVNAYETTPTLKCSTPQILLAMYGKIMDFEGEELGGPAAGGNAVPSTDSYGKYKNLCGYRSASPTTLLGGYNLQQPMYLYYDGHPGYDYPFAFGTPLFPAISGCVTYQKSAGGGATQHNFHVLTIVPKLQKPTSCQNATSDTGYTVAYLHLSSFVATDGSIRRCLDTNGTQCVLCPECPGEGAWVDVSSPQIGYVGNFAVSKETPNGWGGVGSHLHFEVDQWNGVTPIPIDPYGWQPKTPGQADAYSILHPGILNRLLWQQ